MELNASDPKKVVLQGNEACAKGALYAGCRFFAGYPITPSTEIIELMSSEMQKAGGAFIQMEDEIGSACAIIGARWGGKKAMTATSGPGYTLMQEAIGYAAVTETPIVIVNVQRGGPSTGQPTLSSQEDVYQARYGSHGDYGIIVLSPSSVQEMYDFTVRAFELSEQFRTPVILLSDEVVGHMREKITIHDGSKNIKSGTQKFVVSPHADFFQGENSLVEGQLHDEWGRRIGHVAEQSGRFIQNINKKIQDNADRIADIRTYCMEDADIAIVAYGSVARPAANAVKLARGIRDERILPKLKVFRDLVKRGVPATMHTDYSHLKVGLVKINSLWPFPEEELKRSTQNTELIIVPEMNVGKYCREVERVLKDKKVISMPKSGGDIHTPHEILDEILKEAGVNE
ncbi:2-oxoacid:acceptor oxidoreductase subunit alpha [Anaerovorax odorimutans]|uniref:2-oxoacid:acceptor oxidoreductase subunit alpha n=1 Tax=Anaerovorax odorimutans TaxID=109327 RepID=A0ABT1RNA3_9FIRM|nr:2-oxoacid:acceptor oxidoreductase subunit alpha [Anaerovorax odorimutans]MCQ4636662.1 2-oxoacid:acceptor oxidoreductase subunit alpha [Anaerovorax odorimutans]